MQRWMVRRTMVRRMAVVGVLAGMVTVLGCADDAEEVQVAAVDTIVQVTPTTVQALEGIAFAFPVGTFATPALVNQPTTVRFTNTTVAPPTVTITAANGTATGTTTFGSCRFTITASTMPGVAVGQQLTASPCQYAVRTSGIAATGRATTVQILLQLGLVPSAPQPAQVAIEPITGVVTVNNVNTGQSVAAVVE